MIIKALAGLKQIVATLNPCGDNGSHVASAIEPDTTMPNVGFWTGGLDSNGGGDGPMISTPDLNGKLSQTCPSLQTIPFYDSRPPAQPSRTCPTTDIISTRQRSIHSVLYPAARHKTILRGRSANRLGSSGYGRRSHRCFPRPGHEAQDTLGIHALQTSLPPSPG